MDGWSVDNAHRLACLLVDVVETWGGMDVRCLDGRSTLGSLADADGDVDAVDARGWQGRLRADGGGRWMGGVAIVMEAWTRPEQLTEAWTQAHRQTQRRWESLGRR